MTYLGRRLDPADQLQRHSNLEIWTEPASLCHDLTLLLDHLTLLSYLSKESGSPRTPTILSSVPLTLTATFVDSYNQLFNS